MPAGDSQQGFVVLLRHPRYRLDGLRRTAYALRFAASVGWWARRDSNPQPRDYESPALTIELRAPEIAVMIGCHRHR